MPVSVREESKRSPGANKVSALFAKLGTDIEDPLERLRSWPRPTGTPRTTTSAISADALQDWAEFAAPRTFGLAVRAYAGLRLAERHPVVHNLVISNVPGPPVPLYFIGARIEALYPLGPVFHGAGLNITVMSNDGEVHVGIIACRESMPDVDDLVQRFPEELAKLRAAVESRGKATPIRKNATARSKAEARRSSPTGPGKPALGAGCCPGSCAQDHWLTSDLRTRHRREVAAPRVDGGDRLDERRHEHLGLEHAGGVAGVDVVDGGAGDPAGDVELARRRDHPVAGW